MSEWRSFYFLRHGETNWNLEGRFQGQSDIPLNDTGLAQARSAASLLKQHPISSVISSPLERAHKTAAIVADQLSLQVRVEDQLIERSFGSFDGLVIADVKNRHGLTVDQPVAPILPPDAEQWPDTVERSQRVIRDCLTNAPSETILFVAHHGIFRALSEVYTGNALDSEHGVPYEFRHSNDKWEVIELR